MKTQNFMSTLTILLTASNCRTASCVPVILIFNEVVLRFSDLLLSLAPANSDLKDQAAQQALEEAKAGVVRLPCFPKFVFSKSSHIFKECS